MKLLRREAGLAPYCAACRWEGKAQRAVWEARAAGRQHATTVAHRREVRRKALAS